MITWYSLCPGIKGRLGNPGVLDRFLLYAPKYKYSGVYIHRHRYYIWFRETTEKRLPRWRIARLLWQCFCAEVSSEQKQNACPFFLFHSWCRHVLGVLVGHRRCCSSWCIDRVAKFPVAMGTLVGFNIDRVRLWSVLLHVGLHVCFCLGLLWMICLAFLLGRVYLPSIVVAYPYAPRLGRIILGLWIGCVYRYLKYRFWAQPISDVSASGEQLAQWVSSQR